MARLDEVFTSRDRARKGRAAKCCLALAFYGSTALFSIPARGSLWHGALLLALMIMGALKFGSYYLILRHSETGLLYPHSLEIAYRNWLSREYRWSLHSADQASIAVSVINSVCMVAFALLGTFFHFFVETDPCPLGMEGFGDCMWGTRWFPLGTLVSLVAGSYCLYDTLAMLLDDELAAAGSVPTYMLHHAVFATSLLWFGPGLSWAVAMALASEVCNAPTYICAHLGKNDLVRKHAKLYLAALFFLLFFWPFTRILIFARLALLCWGLEVYVGCFIMTTLVCMNVRWFIGMLLSSHRRLVRDMRPPNKL